MFASYLFYQLVDLGLATLTFWLTIRLVRRLGLDRAAARHWFGRTPLRRLWCIEFPAFALLHAALLVLCSKVVYPFQLWFTTTYFEPYAFSHFLNIGTAYYGCIVVFPLAAILRAWQQGASPGERWFAGTTLAATLAFGFHGAFIEPNRLQVEEAYVGIEQWPAGAPPLRIAVLGDVQSALLGSRERRAVKIANELRPDLIVLPGDLVAQSLVEQNAVDVARYVADHLEAPLGVVAVNGDVDEYIGEGITEFLAGTRARILQNEQIVLPTTPPVELGGFDPRDRAGYRNRGSLPALAPIRIGLVHRPRHALDLKELGYDLVISGHCHGGQVVIPGFGPPLTLSPLPRRIAAGGLHDLGGGTQLYVTRGVGMEGGFAPLLRFLCRPEVSLLTVGPVCAGPVAGPSEHAELPGRASQ